MRCITPIKLNKDKRVVPCGGCNFCLQRRRSDWSVRLYQHFMDSFNAFFITLTYDDDHIVYGSGENGTLVKEHFKTFHNSLKRSDVRIKKSRKVQGKPVFTNSRGIEQRVQYYTACEYGTQKGRPHGHVIVFNLYPENLRKLAEGTLWNKGSIFVGSVTHASINYVTKYLIDKDEQYSDQKPFSMMSKGLGEGYLLKNLEMHTRGELKGYVIHNGRKVAMPRYYRDQIFDDMQKEYLNMMGQQEADREYFEELERLMAMDVYRPLEYIKERKQMLHDKIRIKSLKLNSL